MNKATIALGIVGLLALPAGFASQMAEDVTAVTGHTIYVDVSGFDPDIALIAGLASSKVVWFNGVIVIDNFQGGFVYATEAGDCDPTQAKPSSFELIDQDLSFRDPNQVFHPVSHYSYRCGNILADGLAVPSPWPVGDNSTEFFLGDVQHVWITPTHNKTADVSTRPPPASVNYNFATGVNLRFFNGHGIPDYLLGNDEVSATQTCHDGTGGDNDEQVRDGDSYNSADGNHTYGETDPLHCHDTGMVDLYLFTTDVGGSSADCLADDSDPRGRICRNQRDNVTVPSGT